MNNNNYLKKKKLRIAFDSLRPAGHMKKIDNIIRRRQHCCKRFF